MNTWNFMYSNKKVVGFDLDGTLLKGNSSLAFSIYLLKKQIFSFTDFIHIIFHYFRHKFFGLSLMKLHTALFKRLFLGKKASIFQEHIDSFVKGWLSKSSYPPAIACLREFQKNKDAVAVFSNSPYFLVHAIAKELGISLVYATSYLTDSQGRLSTIEILEGAKKAFLLDQFAVSENSDYTIAFSDSILDLPFLQCASCAIAVKPGRGLRKIAKQLGWQII
jgi:HAD superfamily phosphoserine phosphatase-like hydrolase